MCKTPPEIHPFLTFIACKTATPAVGGNNWKNMVSKSVLLSDFKHNLSLKHLHIHINLFSLSKSGPFVRRGPFVRLGAHVPQVPPAYGPAALRLQHRSSSTAEHPLNDLQF